MLSSFPLWRRLPPLVLGLMGMMSILWGQTAPLANNGTPGFSNYQNTPVSSILDTYEQLSGKHLVRDVNLSSVPPITINATGLSRVEMLRLIEATLSLNGVTIVPIDEHSAKVITVGANKNPRSEGIKIYANAADFPADDEVISYYMPLNFITPQEAQSVFIQSAPVHQYGAYVIAASAQALVLTENISVIRQLIALRELIDVPPARVVSEFIQLNRADAEKVADLLAKLLDTKSSASAPPPPPGGGGDLLPARIGGEGPLLNEHSLLSGPAQIVAVPRSNSLLIVTRPVNLPFLRQLVGQLDQPDNYSIPQRRQLKYVLAQDILPALEAALAQGKDEQDEVKKTESSANTPNSPVNNTALNNNSSLGSNPNSGSGSASAITPQLQAPAENNVPTVVIIGKTRLLADNRSNSIIVFGSPDVTLRVFDMIDQLDRRPLQVYLATVIGELTVSEGVEFGIDILQKFKKIGSSGIASGLVTPGTAANGSTTVPEPDSLVSSTGFPLSSGLTLYGAIGNTIDAYVRALQSTNRFKVISRPSVYTTNNKLAVIASGSQVPVPSSTTSGFTGSSDNLATTSSIQYENVLLQLDIIPLINATHQVTLKIRQTNNTLGSSQVISGNSVPTINTQEINTEVTVPDKSTVVIGGLISDNTTRTTSGVPFLSDIPVIGYLFKDTKKNKERDELIIMIQPTVVETEEDQIAVNEEEKQRTILGKEAADAAQETVRKTVVKTTTFHAPQDDGKGMITSPETVTTKTTVTTSPSSSAINPPAATPDTSIVPGASTVSPDVSHAQLPSDSKPPPGSTTP